MKTNNQQEQQNRDYDISIIRPQMQNEDVKLRSMDMSPARLKAIRKGLLTLHTFELMAANIYKFQITKEPGELNRQLIAAMCNEMTHYQDFQVKLLEYGFKPSKLRWAYWLVGFVFGFGSRLFGTKAILKTGIWAETKAVHHYDQLLNSIGWDEDSRRIIEKDQADESGHINRWKNLLQATKEDKNQQSEKKTENQEISRKRKSKRPSVFAVILTLCCCLSSILIAAEENGWSMEFRIAADPAKDTLIVNKAKSSPNTELYEDKLLIAKWVPVIESKALDFFDNSTFATRRNTNGEVELLVLISENDVTESDVYELGTTLDRYGKLALEVCFEDTDPPKIWKLTRKNLYRYSAQIINGQVYNTPQIVSAIHRQAVITGDFTEDTINKMLKDSPFKLRPSYPSPPPYAITVTPLRIIIFLIILLFLIFGSLPTRGLKESKHPRSWIVVGIVVGMVIGGYSLGVSKSTISPEIENGLHAIGQLTHISILGVLSGSVIGGILGIAGGYLLRFIVRRTIHNVSCFSSRAMEALLPSKARALIKMVQEKNRRYLNKKQSAILWIGVLVILLFIIFPPWIGSRTEIVTDESPEGYAGEDYEFLGFHFLFSGEDLSWNTLCIITKIHYSLLALLCGCTAVACASLIFFLRSPNSKPKF